MLNSSVKHIFQDIHRKAQNRMCKLPIRFAGLNYMGFHRLFKAYAAKIEQRDEEQAKNAKSNIEADATTDSLTEAQEVIAESEGQTPKVGNLPLPNGIAPQAEDEGVDLTGTLPSICIFIYLFVCLFIYLFVYLFVCLFVCLFIYLFIYLFARLTTSILTLIIFSIQMTKSTRIL